VRFAVVVALRDHKEIHVLLSQHLFVVICYIVTLKLGWFRAAAGRLQGLDSQLKVLKKEQEEVGSRWRAEKDQMRNLQGIKAEIDRVNVEIQAAEREYDLNRAAELKYGTLLDLQNKLDETEKGLAKQVCPLTTSSLPDVLCIESEIGATLISHPTAERCLPAYPHKI
jgi:hypothetical protein